MRKLIAVVLFAVGATAQAGLNIPPGQITIQRDALTGDIAFTITPDSATYVLTKPFIDNKRCSILTPSRAETVPTIPTDLSVYLAANGYELSAAQLALCAGVTTAPAVVDVPPVPAPDPTPVVVETNWFVASTPNGSRNAFAAVQVGGAWAMQAPSKVVGQVATDERCDGPMIEDRGFRKVGGIAYPVGFFLVSLSGQSAIILCEKR